MSAETIAPQDSAAGVIPAAAWRVQAIEVLPGHSLQLTFRDGTRGIAELAGLVRSANAGLFAALADEQRFAEVRLELGVPTWPNGADLDPCWLYDNIRATGRWGA